MDLAQAPFVACLTGSRVFGNATATSDYDFYTLSTPATSKWLAQHGWKKIIDESYTDQNSDIVFRRGVVDVALVKSVELRAKVQQSLQLLFPHYGELPKEKRKQVWKFAYGLLGL